MVFMEEWPTKGAIVLGSKTIGKQLRLSTLLSAWSSCPVPTLCPAHTRPHLNSQHQADEVYHHLLVGQLNADERQQAIERLVMLLYVRFLLTAQVDVSVELLGVLETGDKGGGQAPVGRVGTGEARRRERPI